MDLIVAYLNKRQKSNPNAYNIRPNIKIIPAIWAYSMNLSLGLRPAGRKPSDKFMEYAQIAGMILMFGLMLYALGLDFWRLFK